MSPPDVRFAARINDKITHSMAPVGQFVGGAAGCIIAVALTAFGVGPAAIIPFTVTSASLGKALADKFAPAVETGEIEEGAATVFYGPDQRNAAYQGHKVKCRGPGGTESDSPFDGISQRRHGIDPAHPSTGGGGHGGEKLDEGSKTVWVELKMASRVAERTNYGGAIKTGIDTIEIGGETIRRTPLDQQLSPEQRALDNFFWGLDWVGTFTNPTVGAMFFASVVLKGLGQASEAKYGKQSTVTLTIKALDTLLSLSKVAKSPKDLKKLKELVDDASTDPAKKAELLKKGTDLSKSGAKVVKESPNYAEKIASRGDDKRVSDETKGKNRGSK